MRVLIDADGCPVVRLAAEKCRELAVPCLLFCDTAHQFSLEGVQVITVDKGADSVDFALVGRILPGDVVITQDYGLASMSLARGARVLHQDGKEYTSQNIQGLLFLRHEAGKFRRSGGRVKGPSKRTKAQDQAFSAALSAILKSSQG